MATSARASKTFTISLPPDLAAKAELLAKRDSGTMSELVRESLRVYYANHVNRLFDESVAYASTRNPKGHTADDVPRLIDEVRAGESARSSSKAS